LNDFQIAIGMYSN